MKEFKKIKNALISVYHKNNLESVVQALDALGVAIYSTGGTFDFIKNLGIPVFSVESLTSYPSILGGRVKTLHPKIFGGILGRRGLESDTLQLEEYQIPEFDLVIVDLYPFEETLAAGGSEQDIIEKIDIGGISLIRAAAKNFNDVLIVSSRQQYSFLIDLLNAKQGQSSLEDRKKLATAAFQTSSHYDTAIFNYFNNTTAVFKQNITTSKQLRYGENPHQEAFFYGDIDAVFSQLSGKELSYNNLLDIDAAVHLIAEFSEPTFAILKHNNACGLASRSNLVDAFKDALAGDTISAFGGVLITNTLVNLETAQEISNLFFEVLIAPAYDTLAAELLTKKNNRIVLVQKLSTFPQKSFKTVLNGVMEQDKDAITDDFLTNLNVVTNQTPTQNEIRDLEFANKIVKHTKSNTIVLAKNKQLMASGMGQTSRVDALQQAIIKAKTFNFNLNGAVMASDAFFPFPDCVEIAHQAGVTAIIQPGGSIKDKDSIVYCDSNNLAMVFTGKRHFRH